MTDKNVTANVDQNQVNKESLQKLQELLEKVTEIVNAGDQNKNLHELSENVEKANEIVATEEQNNKLQEVRKLLEKANEILTTEEQKLSSTQDQKEPIKKTDIKALDLVLVIDKSGSMHGLEKDTIGGFNSMINKQKDLKVDTSVTTVLFDHNYELLYDRKKLEEIPEMTNKDYVTGGSTALLDAIGNTISRLDQIDNINDEDHKVIFAIITDGRENSSREFSKDQIKKLISLRQEKYGWEFIFLGANIDAVSEASSLGIDRDNAVKYQNSSDGVRANFAGIASFCSCYVSQNSKSREAWKDQILKDE